MNIRIACLGSWLLAGCYAGSPAGEASAPRSLAGTHVDGELRTGANDEFVFDAQARLRASSPALLGSARGDDSVAGIGTRPIALVRPEERTTPAGRSTSRPCATARGRFLLWSSFASWRRMFVWCSAPRPS